MISSFRRALFLSSTLAMVFVLSSIVGDQARRRGQKKKRSDVPLWRRGSRARCVDLVAEDLPLDHDRFQVTSGKVEVRSSSGSQRVWFVKNVRLSSACNDDLKLHIAHGEVFFVFSPLFQIASTEFFQRESNFHHS